MDKSFFSNKSPGELIQIDIGSQKDWAFLPSPLPHSLEMEKDIYEALMSAREELARLDGIGRGMPHYEILLNPIQRREALKSSSLEGTIVDPEELFIYEINPKDDDSKHYKKNERKEVFNYIKALKHGQKLLDELPISSRLIRELHEVLMSGVRGNEKNPGVFRKTQVQIGSDKRFIPPPPQYVEPMVSQLEKDIHSENDIDKLIFCFMVHYQFEAIHPFSDGNGRVGRLLLSLMIYYNLGHKVPFLYLSPYFEKYKDEYINKLFCVSSYNDWKSWILFCLNSTIAQARDAFVKFDNLVELRTKYMDLIKSSNCNARVNKIIDDLFKVPVLTIPLVKDSLHITYPTAKKDVELLEKHNIVSPLRKFTHPQYYIATEIFKTVYSD